MALSSRIKAAEAAAAALNHFYSSSLYAERRLDPGISDFTFGNPHEMPLPGLVAAIREHAQPQDKNWFAYKSSEAESREFLAEHVGRELGLTFEPADIALTTGGFAAILVAFYQLLDPGDEAIFSEPAWFCYEPMMLAGSAGSRRRCTSRAASSSSSIAASYRPAAMCTPARSLRTRASPAASSPLPRIE